MFDDVSKSKHPQKKNIEKKNTHPHPFYPHFITTLSPKGDDHKVVFSSAFQAADLKAFSFGATAPSGAGASVQARVGYPVAMENHHLFGG